MTIRLALLAAAALALTACTDPQTRAQLAADCSSMGYRAGTPEHAQCVDVYSQVPVTRPIN